MAGTSGRNLTRQNDATATNEIGRLLFEIDLDRVTRFGARDLRSQDDHAEKNPFSPTHAGSLDASAPKKFKPRLALLSRDADRIRSERNPRIGNRRCFSRPDSTASAGAAGIRGRAVPAPVPDGSDKDAGRQRYGRIPPAAARRLAPPSW